MAPFKNLTVIVLLLVFIAVCFFPLFGGVVIRINEIHMNFLELFLTLIRIKMHPTAQKHTHRNISG